LAWAAQLNKPLGVTTRTCVRIREAFGHLRLTRGGWVQAPHRVAGKARGW
jgi:hypothetical protein